jgi:hypothetical protein
MRTLPFRVGGFATTSGSNAPRTGAAMGARPAAAGSIATSNPASVLEARYPGLVRTLTLLWGHPELTDFLSRVAAGLEPRVRDIDPAAQAELMLLATVHRAICPTTTRVVHEHHSIGRVGPTWRPAVMRR